MTEESLNAIAQLVVQGMVSAVFIYAWSQERRERQELISAHTVERNGWNKELIDLAREAYGLKAREAHPPPITMHDNGHQ